VKLFFVELEIQNVLLKIKSVLTAEDAEIADKNARKTLCDPASPVDNRSGIHYTTADADTRNVRTDRLVALVIDAFNQLRAERHDEEGDDGNSDHRDAYFF
jgi:hypothetical protein